MAERRWPVGWFHRLMWGYKLNDSEYADYAEAFHQFGLKPDPKVCEDSTNDRGTEHG